MYIDGQFIPISNEQSLFARKQLGLPTDFELVEATRFLLHQSGNGLVLIPMPAGQVVAAFENWEGRRRYGVVMLNLDG
ncbi:hypothetical protein ACJ6X8_22520 [Pseudomonas alvandae]|uniref:hypothetical protein n=1 Tax=Pseudomonas TaxID=286 RepID=UPI00389A41C6